MKTIAASILLSCSLLTAPLTTVKEPIRLRIQNWLHPQTVSEVSLEHTLETLTSTSRWAGTDGDDAARAYLVDTFTKYGYEVEEQVFEFANSGSQIGIQNDNTTANIIATKKADVPDSDILIISSHYDTVSGTPGANDNASGTTVLLETAKAIAKLPSDTEIRLIAFGAEEDGLRGSHYYVSTLPEEEKSRIIGDIQLDMLGHYRSKEVLIAAPTDTETLVGNLINDSAEKLTGSRMNSAIESASDHTSFIAEGIPAVLLMQDNLGVENHKVADQSSIISPKKLKSITDIVVDTVKTVAAPETVELSKTAYEITDTENPAYIITDETILFFNDKKSLNDGRIGGPGQLTGQRHDDGLNWDFETYTYQAKWFGIDEAVPTNMEYRVLNGERYLQSVSIDYTESSYSMEQVIQTLTDTYGEPRLRNETSSWESPLSKRQYLLAPESTQLQVFTSYYGSGNTLETYALSGGIEQYADAPINQYHLLEFLDQIIDNDPFVDTLEVWTDGLSYQLGATYPTQNQSNEHFTMRIDINDVFDENGNYRNFDKTLVTFVHEYGHVLTLNHTQTDMSKKDPNTFYYNRDCYLEGSYILDFFNQFWSDLETENGGSLYFEHPDWFVDQYASQTCDEDIAESFAMFVLTEKPDGDTMAEQKIRFFYEYPELVKTRNRIRNAFELS